MRLLIKTKRGSTVNKALKMLLQELNEELKRIDGLIDRMKCEVNAGPAGAIVTISLIINGNKPRKKMVLGVNEKGVNRESSLQKATQRLNKMLKDVDGELVDVFVKTVVGPLPGRAYTTIIAAINERLLEKVLDSTMRRQRIKRALELFNNDPAAINITGVADVFGVSRTIIYKDLEALGFRRGK